MRPRAGGQHRPPRADSGEGELKLPVELRVQASPRLRAPAPYAWWVSHPPERRSFSLRIAAAEFITWDARAAA